MRYILDASKAGIDTAFDEPGTFFLISRFPFLKEKYTFRSNI